MSAEVADSDINSHETEPQSSNPVEEIITKVEESRAADYPDEFIDGILSGQDKTTHDALLMLDPNILDDLAHAETALDDGLLYFESGESYTEVPNKTETAPKASGESSKGKVFEQLARDPASLFTEENGAYTMKFEKGSAAERYLQIQDVINSNYKKEGYYLKKTVKSDRDTTDKEIAYGWNADEKTFTDKDGHRMVILSGDTVNVYKHGEKADMAAEKTKAEARTATKEAPVEIPIESSQKVTDYLDMLSKMDFSKENKDLKRDDLISNINDLLTRENVSKADQTKLEAYRTQLLGKEDEEDNSKRAEKLSAEWQEVFKGISGLIQEVESVSKSKIDLVVESSGPRENNKALILKSGDREIKITVTPYLIGPKNYSEKGASTYLAQAKEGGKILFDQYGKTTSKDREFPNPEEAVKFAANWVAKTNGYNIRIAKAA